MSILDQWTAFVDAAEPDMREALDTVMRILMLPEDEGMSFAQKLDLASRVMDVAPDYASDAEVQAVRARFFRRAS